MKCSGLCSLMEQRPLFYILQSDQGPICKVLLNLALHAGIMQTVHGTGYQTHKEWNDTEV